MSTILASSPRPEVTQSADNPDEYRVTVPAMPVLDWPSVRASLDPELQAMRLVGYIPVRTDDGQSFDGWILNG